MSPVSEMTHDEIAEWGRVASKKWDSLMPLQI